MKRLLLAAIAVLTVFAGCKKDEEETITRIEITEGETINIEVWDELQLHIKHYPEHLYAPSKYICKWSSSNTTVVDVDMGKVTTKSVGEAIITVTIPDNISASCRIVVTPIEIEIPSIKLDNYYEALVGEIIQLKPSASGNINKELFKFEYTSTNDDVAKVGNDGKIEAVGVGECQIKAEAVGTEVSKVKGTVSAVCNVKVLPNEISSITLNKNDLIIDVGESYKFEVGFEPANVTDKTIKWISSNESVATIGEDGTLTGIGFGECTITAISSNANVKAECIVMVSSVRSFELSKTSTKILIGSTDVITTTILPVSANQNVIWTSSDESIATVENGVVTGVAAGTTTITATTEDGLFSQTCEATIGGINIFMSAQNGNVVTTFTNVGFYTYVSCEITNNSSVDVYVKSISIDGNSVAVGEALNSNYKLSKTYYTNSAESVIWIIEYDGVEYEVNSFWNPTFGGFAF